MREWELEEAREAFEYVQQLGGSESTTDMGLGQVCLAEGKYEEALRLFSKEPASTPLHDVYRVAALAGMGEKDRALDLLAQAADGGFGDAPFLESSSWFDPLRGDPRSAEALEKVRRTRSGDR